MATMNKPGIAFLSVALMAAAVIAITTIKAKPSSQKIGSWEVKINKVERTDLIDQKGNEFFTYAAKDGQKLVVIDMQLKNTADSESLLGLDRIKLETAGQLLNQDQEAKKFVAAPLEDQIVKAGQDISGRLVFSAPAQSGNQQLVLELAGVASKIKLD